MTKSKDEMAEGRSRSGNGAGPSCDPVAGKSVAEIFGEIVWLMSQDRQARELPIKDLEWLVMPPILLKQFHITYAPVPEGRSVKGEPVHKAAGGAASARLQPVAVELYAMCSDAVAKALDADPNVRLSFQDWRGGSLRRLVRAVNLAKLA